MKIVVFVLSITLASYGLAADPPAKQPTSKAATRAKEMKRAVRFFRLTLHFDGEADKPYYDLAIGVQRGGQASNRFYQEAEITTGEAEKIIDYLLADGFFDRAVEAERSKLRGRPCYRMHAEIDDNGDVEDLGWGLSMLKRLDGLRKVLDGDAAKKMDVLLERLSGSRKDWEKEEAKAKPADANKDRAG